MKDLFSGSLGRLNNHGGARMYTTPHTIGVQPEYEVETDIPSVAEFVTCTLDGRIWVYQRSRRYYIAVFRWGKEKEEDEEEKLLFVSTTVLSNLNILGRGIDWILTDTMVIQASDNEPYIHTANLFADSNTTFLYSILRSSVFSEKPTGFRINTGSGVDPVTKDAWGKSEDNGNLEGDGYFNRSALIQSVDKQYSLLPAVGDWNIIKNFLIRRVTNSSENDTSSDNPSDNAHNSMLSIRPLIPLEFNYYSSDIYYRAEQYVLDSFPSYGTGYEHDIGLTYFYGLETLKAQENSIGQGGSGGENSPEVQSRIVGQIWGRGLMHIGRCYILPAVFNENGTPEEFYLYISPDFLCSPYNIKKDISPQSNDEWLKIGLFCANEKLQYGFLAEHADSLNNGLCLTSETPKLLKLYSKKVSDDTEGKEDTGEQGGSEGQGGSGGSSGQGGTGEQDDTGKTEDPENTEDTEDDGNSGDDEGNSEGQGSGGSEGSGGSSGSEGSDKPEGSETPEGSEGEQEGSGGQSSDGQETGGESSEGEGTPEGQEATEEEKITEWKELSENGKLFIDPFNKKYLALQENSAILFKGDTTSEDSNVEDNPVDDSSAEGNSANDNSVYECQGLQKWLAPAMQVDAISDDVIISSCDNNALTTHIQQEFFRELLTANRLPVSASLFADKRIALGERTSRNRKNIKVNAIKSDINASPIAWDDIYKPAVEIELIHSSIIDAPYRDSIPEAIINDNGDVIDTNHYYPIFLKNISVRANYAPAVYNHSVNGNYYSTSISATFFYIHPNTGEKHEFSVSSSGSISFHFEIDKNGREACLVDYYEYLGSFFICNGKLMLSGSRTAIKWWQIFDYDFGGWTFEETYHEWGAWHPEDPHGGDTITTPSHRVLGNIPDVLLNYKSPFNVSPKNFHFHSTDLFIGDTKIFNKLIMINNLINSSNNASAYLVVKFMESYSNTNFLYCLPSVLTIDMNGVQSGLLTNFDIINYSTVGEFANYSEEKTLNDVEGTNNSIRFTECLHFVTLGNTDTHKYHLLVFKSKLHPEIFDFKSEVERSKYNELDLP